MTGPSVFCSHTRMASPGDLLAHPDNPNRHPPEQIKMIQQVIGANGWRYPIVVSKMSGYVIKGHGRLQAALEAGWGEVPVDEQDYESEADEYADMVADNKLPEMSQIDIGAVNPMLAYFVDHSLDVMRMGYTDVEAKSILDGWLPDRAALDKIQESDDPVLAKVTVECYEADEAVVKTHIREYFAKQNMPGVIVK